MKNINSIDDSMLTHSEDKEYIVTTLRQKYKGVYFYERHDRFNYIQVPIGYMKDLKFFLERQNWLAVKALLVILNDVPLKKPIGRSENREFKNAIIVFMTLFSNVIIDVFGNREHYINMLLSLINRVEDLEKSEEMKAAVMDTMFKMIEEHNCGDICEAHSFLIANTLKIIQREFRGKIGLKSLAEELSVSESSLSKCFKKELGKTLKTYIMELRIDEAKQLLMKTDETVYDIAISVGFNYQNHFAAVFKKAVGMTPLEYRNRHF